MTSDFQQAFGEAYQRYLEGVRVVSDSFSIPTGLTPKEEVWVLNKTRLYRYTPTLPPAQRYRTPLLLVYALINKPYIFDLRPGRSFVEHMLTQGFDVYLLDWGSPGPEDQRTLFVDYATQYLPRAVRKMLHVAGARDFSMLGYCIGAVEAVIYAALYPDSPLRNLALLTAPLDFSAPDANAFSIWLDQKHFNVDRLVDSVGNIPVELIEAGSKMLKPMDNYVGTYASLWDKLDDEAAVEGWQALHRWVHDGVPFAGEAFRQWVKDFVQANKLIKGQLVVRGQPVDLTQIRIPVLNVIAEYDHIVPPVQSLSILDKVSSADKHLERVPAGHVGIMVGRSAKNNLWPKVSRWLGERSR